MKKTLSPPGYNKTQYRIIICLHFLFYALLKFCQVIFYLPSTS